MIAVRNDRGEEVTRQVVNVGALQGTEKRTFTLSVEVLPPQTPLAGKGTGGGTVRQALPRNAARVALRTALRSAPGTAPG